MIAGALWRYASGMVAARSAAAQAAAWERNINQSCRPVNSLVRESDPGVFSVLIAARAVDRYLADCLDSILHQPAPVGVELEVLIAIDCCEATLSAAHRYIAALSSEMRRRVRVLNFRSHCGLFVIRNSLLLASRGEFVLFVDADDALVPGALASFYSFCRQCAAITPAFLVRPMAAICDDRLQPAEKKHPRQVKGAIGLSKTVLTRLGGFAPWPCAGDRDFLRRAAKADIPVFSLPETQMLYRQHGGQLTRSTETGMKTKLRAHYWRAVEQRSVRGVIAEEPIVGVPDV